MNVLPIKYLGKPLSDGQRLFLELWYGMTHSRSLDTHRVRCLNARTIIRELDHELQVARIALQDLKELCDEADEIVSRESFLGTMYSRHLELFGKASAWIDKFEEKDKKTYKAASEFPNLCFVVSDFSAILERSYISTLLQALPDAIAGGDAALIHRVVEALLSDLVDQGWPLETLFSWVAFFFQAKASHHATFEGNLRFLIQQLNAGTQKYRVILRATGSTKIVQLKEFAGFQLRADSTISSQHPAHIKFAATQPQTLFAEKTVDAVDFASAAIAAREDFENCLDQVQLNFETAPVRLDDRCFVERTGDRKVSLPSIGHAVPNPEYSLDSEQFRDFAVDLDKIFARSDIDAESKERLRAAIRHYRFGKGAESYKDKFLNWWMGLEFLTNVSPGETIGRSVIKNGVDGLAQRYLYRLLIDMLSTIKGIASAWPSDLQTESGVSSLTDLNPDGLLKVLKSSAATPTLGTLFPNNPALRYRITRFADLMQDRIRLADFLNVHLNHLVWQIARLYRIRCNIVHGSPLIFRLALYAANLEFYLHELIHVCIRSLTLNSHIRSLREVYQRAGIARERLQSELRATPAITAFDPVRSAVFNSVIIQENH
jgi:hypothetical protein